MNHKKYKGKLIKYLTSTLAVSFLSASISLGAQPIQISDQGFFSAGGKVLKSEGTFNSENQWEESGAGQTSHVDHASVLYQLPKKQTGNPVVFLHGYGQSRTGWMSTPDGRDGWSDYFLRRGHGVFLIDQPHRGDAGATSIAGTISTKTVDQRWYTQFRIGRWENDKAVLNSNSQFPAGDAAIDQFFRQMTPDTGMDPEKNGADFDRELVAKSVAATIDQAYKMTGKKSILISHSQGGRATWPVAKYTKNIAAIVAIEPGGATEVGSEDYKAMLAQKIPVVFYFGDYIDNGDPKIQATASWKKLRQSCYEFADAYTAAGGKSQVIDLPKIGIYGNDHFIFQDKNSDQVAAHIDKWLAENVK